MLGNLMTQESFCRKRDNPQKNEKKITNALTKMFQKFGAK
jgi:hypothetical protein